MKKNLSVTLGGRSFTIDEDAYFALNAYIEGIRSHYAPEDPDGEIVSDFESRIADLFADEIRQQGPGATITIDAVRRTIERVGSLDRLFDDEEEQHPIEEEMPTADEPIHYDTAAPETETEQRRNPTPPIPPTAMEGPRPRHIYYRSTVDRWLGGVLGGLGEYLGMDALLFRLTFILLLFTPVAPAIILVYLAMTIFVPQAKTVTQRLELHGKPVSPSTIWQDIDETITKSEAEGKEPGELKSSFPAPPTSSPPPGARDYSGQAPFCLSWDSSSPWEESSQVSPTGISSSTTSSTTGSTSAAQRPGYSFPSLVVLPPYRSPPC